MRERRTGRDGEGTPLIGGSRRKSGVTDLLVVTRKRGRSQIIVQLSGAPQTPNRCRLINVRPAEDHAMRGACELRSYPH